MLQVYQRLSHIHQPCHDSITLDFTTRQKARIKASTDSGQAIGIFVDRGNPLKVGEILKTECGKLIQVNGAKEEVNTATTSDWHTFSKVCYHLGNRHTQLQMGELWLRFKPDHVLAELAENYGLSVRTHDAVFEPESGAYGKHSGHSHSHENEHDHGHSHSHDHSGSHSHKHGA
ncbi:urease accessory protein UreE [Catenovulum maritimum]|uniref:Urease accessory protein UreE n=1 Tax=Catenovulum maritimum TaxID=1513271 RepID=A0A0J8GNI5_9ALTE|nr:urease accessory protein UreE [Catenovulum maritimum]KMT64365.1 urease accessory protein UreE [Catenovulum maritimum]